MIDVFEKMYYDDIFPSPSLLLNRKEIIHGCKRNITIHGMRHSATVNLLEQGMEMKDVALFLGHRNTDMVERVYGQFVNIRDLEREKE